jgi:hypothetical protein
MHQLPSIKIVPSGETDHLPQLESAGRLRVTVPYTTPEAARAALRTIAILGQDLRVAVNLVAVQTVPVLWPLAPDSRTIHLREQLTRIAADVAADVAAESHIPVWPVVVLARDYYGAFARVLGPHSVVLISGRRWFSAESRMARRLRKAGLGVIVTKLA